MRLFVRQAASYVVFGVVAWMGAEAIRLHLTRALAVYVLFAAITLAILTLRYWPKDGG